MVWYGIAASKKKEYTPTAGFQSRPLELLKTLDSGTLAGRCFIQDEQFQSPALHFDYKPFDY